MLALVLISGIAGFFQTESMQSYRKYSNHNPVYELVRAVPCENGLRSSGYTLAPTGHLFLKQVNNDGSVGVVCGN